MRIALDTNLLAYAEGVNGKAMRDRTLQIVDRMSAEDIVIPVQALGELFRLLQRKGVRAATDAKKTILAWADAYRLIETTYPVIVAATDAVEQHSLSFWDAVIMSAAASAQCRFLLSEDMQDGFTWRGTTVANPYASGPHPLLEPYLS